MKTEPINTINKKQQCQNISNKQANLITSVHAQTLEGSHTNICCAEHSRKRKAKKQ
jgi:hypothetical protein